MPYADSEKNEAYQRDYHARPENREKARKRSAAAYAADPQSLNESVKRYRKAHPDRVRESNRRWRKANPKRYVLARVKHRAKKRGIDFNLTVSDIVVPDRCPALGIPISFNAKNINNQPSLDRIDNSEGYVSGNVIVVSWRANRIKSDATIEELEAITKFYRDLS